MDLIIEELLGTWKHQDKKKLDHFISILSKNLIQKKIICIGAGRMGYSMKAFSMRLTHLGFNAYFIGETNVPRADHNTVVIISTSSGETKTNLLYANQSKQAGSLLLVLTQNENSSVGSLADHCLEFKCTNTVQPMKSLAEQYTFVLFDHIINRLMQIHGIKTNTLESTHSILE